jgi:hypothetical protein
MAFYGSYNSGVPTHQYYTLSLVNPPKSDNTDQFPVNYRETRNQPFLSDPQSYYASVVRFSCTTPLLPLLLPAIKNVATNETEYTISMHHPALNAGVTVRESVYFESLAPFNAKDFSETSDYYYVYQPIQFINMVNRTFASCWEKLLLGSSFDASGNAPFINWKDSTDVGELWVSEKCFTPRKGATFPYTAPTVQQDDVAEFTSGGGQLVLTMDTGLAAKYRAGDYVALYTAPGPGNLSSATALQISAINLSANTIIINLPPGPSIIPPTITGIAPNTPITIRMNASLYNLFSSFSAENRSSVITPTPPNGEHWQLIFQPTYTGPAVWGGPGTMPVYGTAARPAPSPPAQPPMLYITQQYSTIPLWNPVSSFVFITSILPINPESISAPFTAGSTLSNTGNNSAVGTVLTDFEIPLDKGWETKPTISYAPSAEYRLVDMNGNSNLNNIQISIGWRNKIGVFIPLNIGPNGFAQIKLLFRKRDFNGI